MSDRHLPAHHDGADRVVLLYVPVTVVDVVTPSNPVRFPVDASGAVYYAIFGGLADGEDGWI